MKKKYLYCGWESREYDDMYYKTTITYFYSKKKPLNIQREIYINTRDNYDFFLEYQFLFWATIWLILKSCESSTQSSQPAIQSVIVYNFIVNKKKKKKIKISITKSLFDLCFVNWTLSTNVCGILRPTFFHCVHSQTKKLKCNAWLHV